MLLEKKFLEFHRYVSSHNLPLEAISVGDENNVPVSYTHLDVYKRQALTREGRASNYGFRRRRLQPGKCQRWTDFHKASGICGDACRAGT